MASFFTFVIAATMPQLSVLSRALRVCYENDRISSKLSANMETELALNSLVLNELELQPDEISCLCRFLTGKEVHERHIGYCKHPYS